MQRDPVRDVPTRDHRAVAVAPRLGIGDAERQQVADGFGATLVYGDDGVHLQGPLVPLPPIRLVAPLP